MQTVEVEVYHVWWEFDTDTHLYQYLHFPTMVAFCHGGNMPASYDHGSDHDDDHGDNNNDK